MTWTAVSDTTNPNWGTVSETTDPSWRATLSLDSLAWAQLTPVTEQGDVDFVLLASEEFPMYVSAETARALQAKSSVYSTP